MTISKSDSEILGGTLYHLVNVIRAYEHDDAAAVALSIQAAHAYAREQKPDLYDYVCDLLDRCGW